MLLRKQAAGEWQAWNRQLGHAWARVLRRHQLKPMGTVVEVGPGFADKMGLGLAELRFRGAVIVVEPADAARSWVAKRYRRLLPGAEILATGMPIPGASDLVGLLAGRAVDLLAANHILDDLLLNAAVPPAEAARHFARMGPRAACSQAFVQAWRGLLDTPGRLEGRARRVIDDLTEYVRAVRPGLVVLNHYPSWRHREHGMEAIHGHSLQVLRRLGRSLGARRLRGTAAVRWLVCGGLKP